MFARLMFVGLVLTLVTLPIGVMATGAAALVLGGTGGLTFSAMLGGLVARIVQTRG